MSAPTASGATPTVWIAVHDLSRTGVPIVLSRLLRALPPESRATVHVVAIHGGPLAAELSASCASLTVLEPVGRRSVTGAAHAALTEWSRPEAAALLRRQAWRVRLARRPAPDVLVVHGAGAWPVSAAVPGRPPTVLHLHELATGLDRSIAPDAQPAAFASVRTVLAVSTPVGDLAVARGARPAAIELVPGVVDVPHESRGSSERPTGVAPVVAHGRQAVMGAGTPGWRKGTDRLAAIAFELERRRDDAVVRWVGGAPDATSASAVGRRDPVEWIAETDDPWAVLADAAVIVVPSREDPLPLVALEAGIHGRAVVAMPTGGLVDLLADGRGLVAPTQDVRWCTEAVAALLDTPSRAAALGAALGDHVRAHHLPSVVAPRWWEIVTRAAGA